VNGLDHRQGLFGRGREQLLGVAAALMEFTVESGRRLEVTWSKHVIGGKRCHCRA
jgi:hypothetical protein